MQSNKPYQGDAASDDIRARCVDNFMDQAQNIIDDAKKGNIGRSGIKILEQMRTFLVIGTMTANHHGYETRKKIRGLCQGGLFLVFLIILWADDVDPLNTLKGIKQLKLVYELCGAFPGMENDPRYQVYTKQKRSFLVHYILIFEFFLYLSIKCGIFLILPFSVSFCCVLF
tara:strand:+ start:2254 stop:2766 length:513 start_codon:yes stop_codon:yes gene_type:complete